MSTPTPIFTRYPYPLVKFKQINAFLSEVPTNFRTNFMCNSFKL